MNTDNDTTTTAMQTGAEGVAAPARTPAAVIPENTSTNDATTAATPDTTTPDEETDARRELLRAILRTLPLDVRAALLAAVLPWVLSMRAAAMMLQCTTGPRARRAAGETIGAACNTLMARAALELGAEAHVNALSAVWFCTAAYDCESRHPLMPELTAARADVEALDATVAAAVSVRDAWWAEGVPVGVGLREALPLDGVQEKPLAVRTAARDGEAPRWFLRDDVRAELAASTGDPPEHRAPCGHRMTPQVIRLPMPAEGEGCSAAVVSFAAGGAKTAPDADVFAVGGAPPSQGAPAVVHQGEGEALDVRAELAAIVRDAARFATVDSDGAEVAMDVARCVTGDDVESLPCVAGSLSRRLAQLGALRFTRALDAADNDNTSNPRGRVMDTADAAATARDAFALAARAAALAERSLDGALRVDDVPVPALL